MITSRTNEKIKFIRSLKDKKYRDESGLFVVEGVKSVLDALSVKQSFHSVYATEKGLKALNGAFDGDTEIITVIDDVFKSISDEVTPQGVIAILYKPQGEILPPKGNCIFLDGVSDPSNVGAIIRTASASDYNDIYICDGADAFSPKSVRASMGGIFRVRVYSGSREQLLNAIPYPLIVADMGGKDIYSEKITDGNFCLVIGNEGHGVSSTVRERASITVSIPMENGMESLNASVSAGILMYFLRDKRRK